MQHGPQLCLVMSQAKAVMNETFFDIALTDYKQKWAILLFYPFDFTFVSTRDALMLYMNAHACVHQVCPTEIISFSEHIESFHSINTEVSTMYGCHAAW
jgi:alkyl hydroperoxide reductase subunit AhpC